MTKLETTKSSDLQTAEKVDILSSTLTALALQGNAPAETLPKPVEVESFDGCKNGNERLAAIKKALNVCGVCDTIQDHDVMRICKLLSESQDPKYTFAQIFGRARLPKVEVDCVVGETNNDDDDNDDEISLPPLLVSDSESDSGSEFPDLVSSSEEEEDEE